MGYPSFAVGDVLTANDMNAVGLWRVTGCTVTSAGGTAATASNGVVTVGTSNTSVTVNSAFSSSYRNYRIVFNMILSSAANPALFLTFGSTATAYYGVNAYYAYDASGDGTAKRNNGTEFSAGYFGTNHFQAVIDVYSPQLAARTAITGQFAGDLYYGTSNGMLGNNTQYTAFTIAPSSGNISGGTIRVYGYRD